MSRRVYPASYDASSSFLVNQTRRPFAAHLRCDRAVWRCSAGGNPWLSALCVEQEPTVGSEQVSDSLGLEQGLPTVFK